VHLEAVYNSRYVAQFINPADTLIFQSFRDPDQLLAFDENGANEYLKGITPTYYGRLHLHTIDYLKLSKNFQLIPTFSAGLILSEDSVKTTFIEKNVGGFQQVRVDDTKFLGLNYGEMSLENFGVVGLMLQNVVLNNFFISYGANVLAYHEHVPLFEFDKIDFSNMLNEQVILGYGGEITYKSLIGPISLGVTSNTKDGYVRVYFALGYSFNVSD
jgi:NTE family protein